jgi:hypothetical protein
VVRRQYKVFCQERDRADKEAIRAAQAEKPNRVADVANWRCGGIIRHVLSRAGVTADAQAWRNGMGKPKVPGTVFRTRGKTYCDTSVRMILSTQPCPVTIITCTGARRCNDSSIDRSWICAVSLPSLQRCACRCEECGTERRNDTISEE